MVELSYELAARQALVKQSVALSGIKRSTDQEKAVANILDQSVRTVDALNNRGRNVNFTA